MRGTDAILHLKDFIYCRDCNSRVIGKGQGTLEVTESQIKRSCKCGFCVVRTIK